MYTTEPWEIWTVIPIPIPIALCCSRDPDLAKLGAHAYIHTIYRELSANGLSIRVLQQKATSRHAQANAASEWQVN